MIKILGQLAIRTITGRNGAFNVGRLKTSVGEFVIKDAQLDQYSEGKYQGEFVIAEIKPSTYTYSGGMVVEIRARLESMSLDGSDDLTPEDTDNLSHKEVDPLDEETAPSPIPQPKRPEPVSQHKFVKPVGSVEDETPFGMSPQVQQSNPEPVNEDEALFGTLWPLGPTVRLDSSVDRARIRLQRDRLDQLGYTLDYRSQLWQLSS